MVTRAILVFLFCMLLRNAPAAPVTFWFNGVVTQISNPSNALPFEVSIGMPFTGRFTYDESYVAMSNLNSYPQGDTAGYYFTNTAGASILFQIAGHTITNVIRQGEFTGYVIIYDQYNNEDSYWANGGKRYTIDGNPFLAPPFFSGISFYLDDNSKTAFNTVALPASPPVLNDFDRGTLTWGAYHDNGGPSVLFAVEGELTHITVTEQLILNHRRISADTLQLGWPVTISGFTLESSTNLVTGNWQAVTNPVVDVNVEHTVDLPDVDEVRFFRLKK